MINHDIFGKLPFHFHHSVFDLWYNERNFIKQEMLQKDNKDLHTRSLMTQRMQLTI